MRYIIAATAFALVAGIALGFVLSRGLDGSASAAPKAQAVEEQNLDGGGFIAVHEQGTADVNVTNAALPVSGTVDVGNLPAVQDVNVLSQAAPEGRLISLTLVDTGSHARSPFVDISDCGIISVFSRGTVEDEFFTSPDGTIRIKASFSRMGAVGSGPDSQAGGSQINVNVALPFIQLNSQPRTTTSAWIWCAP